MGEEGLPSSTWPCPYPPSRGQPAPACAPQSRPRRPKSSASRAAAGFVLASSANRGRGLQFGGSTLVSLEAGVNRLDEGVPEEAAHHLPGADLRLIHPARDIHHGHDLAPRAILQNLCPDVPQAFVERL